MCLGYNVAYGREDTEQNIEDTEQNIEEIEDIIPPFSNEEWQDAINRALHGIY
jgi:hypothetical protein